jgi:hypothetical protein
MRSNIDPPQKPEFARAVYPGSSQPRDSRGQLSLTIAITIEAKRQATMITMLAIQRRGMPRS